MFSSLLKSQFVTFNILNFYFTYRTMSLLDYMCEIILVTNP